MFYTPAFLRIRRVLSLALCAVLAQACGAPAYDGCTLAGKQAIFDSVNDSLSTKNCSVALTRIQSLYASGCTDNETRLLMASVYGCFADISLFKLVGDISANSDKLSNSQLWEFLTATFPSTTADRVVEGGELASDALMAAVKPGWPLIPSYLFNTATNNPGSFITSDRIADANAYLIFASMAIIGGLQNRYGAPDSTTHKKSQPMFAAMPAATDMLGDGCAYASAIVNLSDSVGATATEVGGTLAQNVAIIDTAFSSLITAACEAGCTSGGSCTTACTGCPKALRYRGSCTGAADDQTSCAAAGVVTFMNNHPAGWQGP